MSYYPFRKITEDQARAVRAILHDECGCRVDGRETEVFVRAIMTEASDRESVCHEYRFCGALGFGGKFRNNGNNENVPYVDCYREDQTPARMKMIAKANSRLAELFKCGEGP